MITARQEAGTSQNFATATIQLQNDVKKKSKRSKEPPFADDYLKTTIDKLAGIATENQDEFDAFGLSIAAQLRSLPMMDAVELQMEIQQLITSKRLLILRQGDLRSSSTSPAANAPPSPFSQIHSPYSSQESLAMSSNSTQESFFSGNQHFPIESPSQSDILSESIRGADIDESYVNY